MTTAPGDRAKGVPNGAQDTTTPPDPRLKVLRRLNYSARWDPAGWLAALDAVDPLRQPVALAAALPALHARIAELEKTALVWRRPEEFVWQPKNGKWIMVRFPCIATGFTVASHWSAREFPAGADAWAEMPAPPSWVGSAREDSPPTESPQQADIPEQPPEPTSDTYYLAAYVKRLAERVAELEARPTLKFPWSDAVARLIHHMAISWMLDPNPATGKIRADAISAAFPEKSDA